MAPPHRNIHDALINRVNDNWRKGKRTHVFIDEIHVIFENEESATFFASAWRQFRKRDAYPTGITQNVKYWKTVTYSLDEFRQRMKGVVFANPI